MLGSIATTAEEANSAVNALTGGDVELPLLSVLSGPVDVESENEGSKVNLAMLADFPGGSLTVTNQGTVADPVLTTLSGVSVTLDATGTLATNKWVSLTSGMITLTSGTYSFVGLTDIDGSNVESEGGANLTVPAVQEYTEPNFAGHGTFQASGANSVLSLPMLGSITTTGEDASSAVSAVTGGDVELPLLSMLGGVDVASANSGSKINLAMLTDFAGGSLTVTNQGTVADPVLTTLSGVSVTLDATGMLATHNWVSLTNGAIALTSGTYSFVGLTDIDGSSVESEGGANLTLPAVQKYTEPYFAGHGTFEASGANSVLSLPMLGSVSVTGEDAASAVIALTGGDVELPLLSVLSGPVNVASENASSTINLTELAEIDGGSLTITTGGTVVDPNLATLVNATITTDPTGTFNVPAGQTLTFPSGTTTINTGTVPDLGSLSVEGSATLIIKGNLTLSGQGGLSVASNSTLDVSGNLLGNTTNAAAFAPLGTVALDGTGTSSSPQLLEAMSQDLGDGPAGFNNNFAYGTLELTANTYVELVDNAANSPGDAPQALYVNDLIVPAGATLNLDGLNLYVHTEQVKGTIISGGAVVSGEVFNDLNDDGTLDNGDPGLSGWTVKLTNTSTSATYTATTNGNGLYSLSGVAAGTYTLADVLQPGYAQTTPASGSFSITTESGGQFSNEDFGVYQSPQGPVVYTVSSTADSGAGSLREAIDQANTNGGAGTIAFAIGTGPQTIDLLSALPAITAPVTIDGTTQHGYAHTPLIELDGAGAGAGTNGLTITGDDITVKGLIIGDFFGDGIELTGNHDLIESNYIGTNAMGTAALGNSGDGVDVTMSTSITIGGTSLGAGNLISGNGSNGVALDDSSSTLVQGNMIGLDQTGTLANGNAGSGVLIDDGSASNTVGGLVAGARNFISGNAQGVLITGTATLGTLVAGNLIGTNLEGTAALGNLTAGIVIAGGSGATIGGAAALARNVISGNVGDGIDLSAGAATTLIQGNFIGTDQTGTKPLPNSGAGVSLDPTGATIGGSAQGAGNVISANAQSGVSIAGTTTTGVLIQGNRIGTDTTGTAALGNGSFGVLVNGTPGVTIGGTAEGEGNIISASATAGIGLYGDTTGALVEDNLIGTDSTGSLPLGNGTGILIDGGSSNNTIGGTASGAGNTIAFSTGIGVDVDATAGTGNEIRLNSIFSNTKLGIDLGGDGVTLNNSAGHVGPNDYQNFPILTAVTSAGGVTTVAGTLNSTPDSTFAIDFYTLSSLNASGYGEGRYSLGSASVMTDATGNASFDFQFPNPTGQSRFVSATATGSSGNTSEFSQAFGFDIPPTANIGFTSISVNVGAAIPFSGLKSTDPSGLPLSYAWSFGDGGTATGPAPTHTYTALGTDTVTLTVSDGFGGESTATATVTVVDVPPVFTPNSFASPLTFTTPSPGAGFGQSVASVDGDVAIGAPNSNSTGAVYFYDGLTTANQSVSTFDYGQLIHVFADPNPQPGDQFGASLAVVGNELVVGAPGSSLNGQGNGVAYVFDANAESTTFGAVLATLTIPDAGGMTNAQFGAAVGATDTNILVGAPAADGGKGAVYEFEGDTTQSNFGKPLLNIPNPTSQLGSDFGAAVAGDGNNLIVGAPAESLAGATGGVFVFDGTTGNLITSIANPDTLVTTGFGSAVASVGPNILIGSPDDNDGAGAAFLYAPPATVGAATLLTAFVQPDGAGGNFGASVAGSQNTALVGAPGANLGTSDSGAVYVFDANPASPTFSDSIAAVQEPLPTSGAALGTAVGLDDGALVAGAPGSEAVDLYQPTVAISLSSSTTFANGSFNSVLASGTFMDANPSVPLTASINWGDGSPATVLNLPVGSYAFSAPHDYTAFPASGFFTIGVTLTDPYGESCFAQTTLAISNPAPSFAAPGLAVSSSSIVEGGTVSLSGTIKNPDGAGANSVTLNWGDGSEPTTIILPAGQDTFSTTHTYLNNPAGVESENFTVVGSVTGQNGLVGYASASVTVSKVAPEITAADLGLSATTVNEGDTITLVGQFTDPDAESSYTVSIDWGDGSTPTPLSELDAQIVQSATPGLYTFSAAHQYSHAPAGEQTGGSYAIEVSVSDSVNTASAGTSIVVNNISPAVQISSSAYQGSGTITLSAGVTDPNPLATDTVAWTLTENGIEIGTATGTSFTFPIASPLGALVATATVTSSDGGVGTASAQLVLINQQGASVVINASGITVSVGGTPVSTITSAGAGQVVVLVTGSNDLIDASTDTSPVQLVSSGRT